MATTVICPQCGAVLSVRAQGPVLLVCPRCLSSLAMQPAASSPETPQAAIPIRQELNVDTRSTAAELFVLALFFVGAAAASYSYFENTVIAALLAIAGLTVICSIWYKPNPKCPQIERLTQPLDALHEMPDRGSESKVLEYAVQTYADSGGGPDHLVRNTFLVILLIVIGVVVLLLGLCARL